MFNSIARFRASRNNRLTRFADEADGATRRARQIACRARRTRPLVRVLVAVGGVVVGVGVA